jgi:UDP-2,4-diacetamido-2,4,6-trideoxy-beta-L-altropyranose hydrolase
MRCLVLARELARRGAKIDFISRELPAPLRERIEREGYGVVHLPAVAGARAPADKLGVPALEDARATYAVLEQLRPRWLIVDHYGIDAGWEAMQRPVVESIIVIDDLADRAHNCDVLLDQNYNGPATAQRYDGLVPERCLRLLGPRYALLRPEYAIMRRYVTRTHGEIRRVLVSCGGADPSDETSKILRALSAPEFRHLALDVVIGANHPQPRAVEELAASRPATTLFRDLPSLAGLMLRADLAIGAGGTSTWERLCLQLPSVAITIAANQEPATAALHDEQIIIWAGRAPAVSVEEIANAVRAALAKSWSGRSLVDGFGVLRLIDALLPSVPAQLRLYPAQAADCELLFDWRNEPHTRAMSSDTQPIDWAAHVRWFEATVTDPQVELLVAWQDELPVGQVRLDARAGETVLSYGVDPAVRGRGFGTQMVASAAKCAQRSGARSVRAHVKAENVASRRIFERLGWELVASTTEVVYRLNSR